MTSLRSLPPHPHFRHRGRRQRSSLRSLGNKNGSKRREADHNNSHTSFTFHPESLPCTAIRAIDLVARNSNAGGDDREDAEAEERADSYFLAEFDFHLPEKNYRDTDGYLLLVIWGLRRTGGQDLGL